MNNNNATTFFEEEEGLLLPPFKMEQGERISHYCIIQYSYTYCIDSGSGN